MSIGLVILEVIILLLVFLISLNENLLGNSKETIRTTLFLLHVVVLIAVFFAYGWITGFVTILLILLFAIISAPLARTAAHKILGFRPSSAMLGTYTADRAARDRSLLAQALASPEIESILKEFGSTSDDVWTWADVVTPEVVLRAVMNPDSLRKILQQKARGEPDVLILHKLRTL